MTELVFTRKETAELGARLGTLSAMAAQVVDAVCQYDCAILRLGLIRLGV